MLNMAIMSIIDEDDDHSPVGDIRREARKAKEKAKAEDPTKVPTKITSKTYLVIDDEKPMRTLIKNALQNYGIRTILEASSAEEAITNLKHQQVDLIFIDEEMPGMSGAEFVFRARRGALPINKTIPIIMVTSHLEQEHIKLSRNAGVDEFLAKPVSAAALYKRVYNSIMAQRPFVEDADGYRGPERRWLKAEAEAKAMAGKPHVKVFDYNEPKTAPAGTLKGEPKITK
ncbi:MAG: response regulator [Rhodospirillaceae bacterium]|nr:response regulator [Rhodospirillaceae bacterium]